jgi:hypothetical protein
MDAPVELDYLPLAETVDPFSSLKGNLFVFLNDVRAFARIFRRSRVMAWKQEFCRLWDVTGRANY